MAPMLTFFASNIPNVWVCPMRYGKAVEPKKYGIAVSAVSSGPLSL